MMMMITTLFFCAFVISIMLK